MSDLKLKTATRTQGNNKALKDGAVKPKTFDFAFEEVDPIIAAFRRMVRGNEFDICEMAITTYICAKEHGKPMTAVPIFLVRAFHHGAILANTKVVRSPKDLEGKKVGVNRGYTVTTGVWARGILQDEHGVDLSKITWVLSGDEHVAEYKPPSNVVPIEEGKDMAEMLASGELAAAIGIEFEVAGRRAADPERAGGGPQGAARPRPLSDQPLHRDQGRAAREVSRSCRRRVQRLRRVEAAISREAESRADREADRDRQAAPAGDGDHRRSACLTASRPTAR